MVKKTKCRKAHPSFGSLQLRAQWRKGDRKRKREKKGRGVKAKEAGGWKKIRTCDCEVVVTVAEHRVGGIQILWRKADNDRGKGNSTGRTPV